MRVAFARRITATIQSLQYLWILPSAAALAATTVARAPQPRHNGHVRKLASRRFLFTAPKDSLAQLHPQFPVRSLRFHFARVLLLSFSSPEISAFSSASYA
jgi:hypothetical protein